MTQFYHIHPKNPQRRLLDQAANIIAKGGVIILPVDSGYSFCCGLGQANAAERIRRLRQLDKNHYFTLLCYDFSQVSAYASVDNSAFRFLKAHTPAPVTFILRATKEVPRRLMHPKRRTIGVRIPDSKITQTLLEIVGEPLMSVSVEASEVDHPPMEVTEIYEKYENQVELVIDSGVGVSASHTTVIDLTTEVPTVVRQGEYHI